MKNFNITNYNLKGFEQFIFETTKDHLPPEKISQIVNLFHSEIKKHNFSKSSESNLIRIISAFIDKIQFLKDCVHYPHHVEITVTIANNSNFLTDVVVRNPEYLYYYFNPINLSKEINEDELFNELKFGINNYKSFERKVNFLRIFKNRIMLKIGLNDIYNNHSLINITKNLTNLAKSITNILFDLCLTEVLSKNNIKSCSNKYALISLGKMGGNELNYSSDIDFILIYDKNSKVGTKKLDFYNILLDATHLFIKSATEFTAKGSLYRVDFRLRPDGRNSTLVKTFAEALRYYETKGEDWERQMLIKMNFAAGDKSLYNNFSTNIQSFIFPKSFIRSPFEQIRLMKKNIEKRLTDNENIKLLPGGIRDIEFSVQALQLVNAGKIEKLRTGNTLLAIELLKDYNLLSENETAIFSEAYILFRKVEHYLQLMNDRQTHSLPQEGEITSKLAMYLGFGNSIELIKEINSYRDKVSRIFNSIFVNNSDHNLDEQYLNYSGILNNNTLAVKNIKFLRTGIGLIERKEFDRQTIDLFSEIENILFDYLSKCIYPEKVLDNFVKIIRATKTPSIYYKEFQNEKFFVNFLKICEYSQIAVELLSLNPSFGDLLLSRFVFIKNINSNYDVLSFNKIKFILAVQLCLKLIDQKQAAEFLTSFIDYVIKKNISPILKKHNFFIGGLGSFGINEMNFFSDIDLIIVANDILKDYSIQSDFQNIVKNIKSELPLLEIDFRLRPEGKSSQLVWDIKAYKDYFNKRARIWEYQAFLKLRFIEGNKEIYDVLVENASNSLSKFNKDKILPEVKNMYQQIIRSHLSSFDSSFNFKKSNGGIVTVDFLLQYLVLIDSNLYKKSIGNDYNKMLNLLRGKAISEDNSDLLKESINFLKTLEIHLQNILNKKNNSIPENEKELKLLFNAMNFKDKELFYKTLNDTIKSNITLFEKYIIK